MARQAARVFGSLLFALWRAFGGASYVDDVWRTTANEAMLSAEALSLKGTFMSTGKMSLYVSRPTLLDSAVSVGRSPVVIVAHHAVGIYHASFLRQFTDSLAAAGYIAILPDFFHRVWADDVPTGWGMPFEAMKVPTLLKSLNDSEVVDDLQTTIDFLISKEGQADTQKIAVLGFCMGGRIAWLSGITTAFAGRVRAVVAYHGGNMFKTWPPDSPRSAPATDLAKLHCPVLGHFGDQDSNPSLEDMEKLRALSQASGQKVEFHVYPGANHGFSCRDSSQYMKEAADKSWQRTLQFLLENLGSWKANAEL